MLKENDLNEDSEILEDKEPVIIKNAIKCRKCGEEIESRYTHDFKTCKCGACSVDGGHEYLRRLGDFDAWEDISITR